MIITTTITTTTTYYYSYYYLLLLIPILPPQLFLTEVIPGLYLLLCSDLISGCEFIDEGGDGGLF